MIVLPLNANQARALSNSTDWFLTFEAKTVFDRISDTAKEDAEDEKNVKSYETYFSFLSSNVINALEKLGYEVYPAISGDRTQMVVSWRREIDF